MNKNFLALSSLAMDLKRVSLASFNGSYQTANRFADECNKRVQEVDTKQIKQYLRNVLTKVPLILKDKERITDDALMYSTIIQNYVVHYL